MDALSSTDMAPGRRKRKLSTAPAGKATSTSSVVPPSPEDKKPTPPSVCRVSLLQNIVHCTLWHSVYLSIIFVH